MLQTGEIGTRIGIMHRETGPFVFSVTAGKFLKQTVERTPRIVTEACRRERGHGILRATPKFRAMNATGAEAKRCKQPIQLRNRPAPDERQRAIQDMFDGSEIIQQTRSDLDRVWARRNVEQGSVDV